MEKKKKRNNKRVNPPEINKRILNGFLDMESDAGNMMELFGGFWPLIEKKEQDILNIRDRTKVPPLDFSKIISKEQPSGTKIAKYMDGKIKVSKFSVGQVVKLKDHDNLKLVNDTLTYQMEESNLRRISNAQVAIYKVLGTRQIRKDGEPVFWYEVGQWGRNIVDVPEDFLEELPEPVNIPDDNEEGEKQPENPVEETMDEMVEKFKANRGFVKACWCGDPECEGEVKYQTGGAATRCLIEDEEFISDKCIYCGKPAKHMAYWGKSY